MPIQPPQPTSAHCVCPVNDNHNTTTSAPPTSQPTNNTRDLVSSTAANVPLAPLMLQPVDLDAVENLSQALGLPNDERGQALGLMLYQLGYKQVEHWQINSASLSVGPDENGISIPVVRNVETQCVVVPHEYHEAGKFWLELIKRMPQKFSGRFNWNREMQNNTPEGTIILRLGAEPYHLAEEHFHHAFSRANILHLQKHEYVLETMLPRVGDSEAYAATMAYRLMSSSPEFKKWCWGGHEDIALGLAHHKNTSLLEAALKSEIDLEPVRYPSADKNDGRPTRAARSITHLNRNEFDAVGIERFDSNVSLSWFDLREANIPGSQADESLIGLSSLDLKYLPEDD